MKWHYFRGAGALFGYAMILAGARALATVNPASLIQEGRYL
jgi:hypothetical protein